MEKTAPIKPGQTLHLVVCEQGNWSYSDYRFWVVAAYVDRTEAERHAQKAQAWIDRVRRIFDAAYDRRSCHDNPDNWDAFFKRFESLRSPFDVDLKRGASGDPSRKPKYSVQVLGAPFTADDYKAVNEALLDEAKEKGWVSDK